MWKNGKKCLALMLALTMSFGEFLPASAAAPGTGSAVAESAEVAAAAENSVVESADTEAPKMETAEENAVEAQAEESGESTVAPEAQSEGGVAVQSMSTIVTDGTVLNSNEDRYEYFQVGEAGFYYVEAATSDDWYILTQKEGVQGSLAGNAPGKLLEDNTIPKCWYLDTNTPYTIALSGTTTRSFTFHKWEVAEAEDIAVGSAISRKAGAWGIYKVSGEIPGNGMYISIPDRNAKVYAYGNIELTNENAVQGEGAYWRKVVSLSAPTDRDWSYIVVEPGSGANTVLCKEDVDTSVSLNEWSGEYTIPAWGQVAFRYTPDRIGEYLVTSDNIPSVYVDGSGSILYEVQIGSGKYSGFINERVENQEVIVYLSNNSDTDTTVTFKTDRDIHEEKELKLNESWTYDAKGAAYLTFEAPKTGIYTLERRSVKDNSLIWNMSDVWAYIEGEETEDWGWLLTYESGIWLEKGQKLRIGESHMNLLSEEYPDGHTDKMIVLEEDSVQGTTELMMQKSSPLRVCAFTPRVTGTYVADGRVAQMTQDEETGKWGWESWQYDDTVEDIAQTLEAGVTYYLIPGEDKVSVSLYKRQITVLDYDYYNAFIASGASVTVDDSGNVNIKRGGRANWTLKSIISGLIGKVAYAEDWKNSFQKFNAYWKKAGVGEFQSSEFYRLNSDSSVEEIQGYQYAEDGDVVLIKYEPEIVWVQSMTIQAPNTTIEPKDQMQLSATLNYGQTKADVR